MVIAFDSVWYGEDDKPILYIYPSAFDYSINQFVDFRDNNQIVWEGKNEK